MLAYYYQRPAPQSRLTDTLAAASPASDRRHHHHVTGQLWAGTRTYQYEGTADTINITDSGTFIGTWYEAGRNPYRRWADTDFIIPQPSPAAKPPSPSRSNTRPAALLHRIQILVYSLMP